MLFEEKQRVIENQLFGVDLNPNSTQITKLRLWIELLKNSFYDENSKTLVTLPNIDINIKTGNSLISRFDLNGEIKINNIKHEIKEYKQKVKDYKNNLGSKKDVLDSIKALKDKFKLTLKAEHKLTLERNKKLQEYVKDFGFDGLSNDLVLIALERKYGLQGTLFDDKKDKKEQQKQKGNLVVLQEKINDIENGKIYEDAFEWRIEFPEVLDEDGNFLGFDIVLGNPPYIQLQNSGGELANIYSNFSFKTFERTGDIYSLFYEKGLEVLKDNGLLAYITSNKWLRAGYGKSTREFFLKYNPIKLIDLGSGVFDSASVDSNILFIENEILKILDNLKDKNEKFNILIDNEDEIEINY